MDFMYKYFKYKSKYLNLKQMGVLVLVQTFISGQFWNCKRSTYPEISHLKNHQIFVDVRGGCGAEALLGAYPIDYHNEAQKFPYINLLTI